METILIPPTRELKNYPQRRHLVLSDVYQNNVDYQLYYRKLYNEDFIVQPDYIILDNSAYENGKYSNIGEYFKIINELKPQEIVVPDVLGDREETYKAAKSFFDFRDLPEKARLMLVPHGNSPYEWESSFYELGELYYRYFVNPPVIGVARRYEDFPGGLYNRMHFLSQQRRRWNNPFDVHMLGWGKNIWAIVEIAKDFPWVRSIDSAKPFHHAIVEVRLPLNAERTSVGRPKDYFDHPEFTPHQSVVAEHNITIFQLMAEGKIHR